MMPSGPSREDIEAAFRAGTPVRCGWPVVVRSVGSTHVLNLVAAQRGDPDPWHTYAVDGPVTDLASASYRTLAVGGQPLRGEDVRWCDAALDARPSEDDRHSQEGHVARMTAGKAALRIRNAHARVAILSHVDGWVAVADPATVIDEGPDGALYPPPPETKARILVVTCPSTARQYAIPVPAECATAAEARRWVMRLEPGQTPDIET